MVGDSIGCSSTVCTVVFSSVKGKRKEQRFSENNIGLIKQRKFLICYIVYYNQDI